MPEHLSADEQILNHYAPLFREAFGAITSLIEDMEEPEGGDIIINGLDFYHLHDFMWNSVVDLQDPIASRNIWTMKNLAEQSKVAGMNLAISRGTVLEICDSILHKIERLDAASQNRKLIADLRTRYHTLEKNALQLLSLIHI